MTDSAIWWKADTQRRAEVTSSRISASVSWASLLSVVVLGGLSGCGQEDNNAPSAEVLSFDQPAAEMSLPRPSSLATGLIPLPTREQVLSSVPEGRVDPFAPILGDPEAFKVKGVMAVGAELRRHAARCVGLNNVLYRTNPTRSFVVQRQHTHTILVVRHGTSTTS